MRGRARVVVWLVAMALVHVATLARPMRAGDSTALEEATASRRASPAPDLLRHYLGTEAWYEAGDAQVRAWAAPGWEEHADAVVTAARWSVPRVARELGLPPERVLPIWIVVSPGGGRFALEAPSWSAAIARPAHHLVVISGPALHAARMNLRETVAHEVAHVALGECLGEIGWMPRWLHEGLAVHLSDYRRARDRLVFWGRGPIHLRELTFDFPSHPARARLAYLESHAAVQRLLELGPVAPLLDRLARGEEFDAAFTAAYRMTPAAFAEDVYGQVARRWRYLALATSGATLFGVLTVLFVVAASVRRIRDRRRRRQWDEEEEALAVLHDEPPRPDL